MGTGCWRLRCTHCRFRSSTSGRTLAESMAETHETATGHTVDVCRERPR
ncbi:hypothetical protein [Halomarina rubra]|uniref:Uncharacterized protein n=1 Tax=Halomarina rubra TaxID=2071873 RepID=A0ABD6AWG7_9EURY|nr:hypothetical protein [Halomarina rubra]